MKRILVVRQATPRVLVGVARGRPGVRGYQGHPGVSIAGVVIDGNQRLQVELSNGAVLDAGQLPSLSAITQLQQAVAVLEQSAVSLGHSVTALGLSQAESQQMVSEQQQVLVNLLARVEALESGQAIPPNALYDAGGSPLTYQDGTYLTIGAAA